MNDYSLAEVFNCVYKQEFSEFDYPPKHIFSRRHRKAMKKILHPHTQPKPVDNQNITLKRRLIIALIIALLMAFGITAGAVIVRGFARQEHSDNTEIFAVNNENAPKTIEYVYCLSVIPDGYKSYQQLSDSKWIYTSYIDPSTNKLLIFEQYVKEDYHAHFDNESQTFEQLDINGNFALYLGTDVGGSITWDNEDYVLEVFGCLTKDELILLAESVEANRNVITMNLL